MQQVEGSPQQRNGNGVSEESYQVYPGANLFEERDRQRRRLGMELQELSQEIEASDGYQVHKRIRFLERSYFAFDANQLNLRHILIEFEQPMVFLRLWEDKDGNRFNVFIDDVIRLFHNYLAGATTLLDHIDTLRDGLNGETDFSDEYQARWEEQLGKSAIPRFMEDLLVYMLHEGLPFALAELNFGGVETGVEVDSAIKLDIRKLSKWEGWSEKGHEYLNTLDEKVRITDLVGQYTALLADFYRWFVARQAELHGEILEELDKLQSRREELRQEFRELEDFLEAAEKTALTTREEKEKLAKELEAEKKYRERDRERVERLEAHIDRERAKGFWSRLFAR